MPIFKKPGIKDKDNETELKDLTKLTPKKFVYQCYIHEQFYRDQNDGIEGISPGAMDKLGNFSLGLFYGFVGALAGNTIHYGASHVENSPITKAPKLMETSNRTMESAIKSGTGVTGNKTENYSFTNTIMPDSVSSTVGLTPTDPECPINPQRNMETIYNNHLNAPTPTPTRIMQVYVVSSRNPSLAQIHGIDNGVIFLDSKSAVLYAQSDAHIPLLNPKFNGEKTAPMPSQHVELKEFNSLGGKVIEEPEVSDLSSSTSSISKEQEPITHIEIKEDVANESYSLPTQQTPRENTTTNSNFQSWSTLFFRGESTNSNSTRNSQASSENKNIEKEVKEEKQKEKANTDTENGLTNEPPNYFFK